MVKGFMAKGLRPVWIGNQGICRFQVCSERGFAAAGPTGQRRGTGADPELSSADNTESSGNRFPPCHENVHAPRRPRTQHAGIDRLLHGQFPHPFNPGLHSLPPDQALVKQGQVAPGMDIATVKLALGDPDHVSIRTTASGQTQVWHYITYEDNGVVLYAGYYHRWWGA